MPVINQNAVFCLLARDCGKNLKKNIPIIEEYRKTFTETAVIVIENDSKDNTNEILDGWQTNYKNIIVKHIDSSNFAKLERIERMCVCRNEYMNEIKKLSLKVDLMILCDADVELQKLDLKSIIESAPKDWTGLFANGQYYTKLLWKKWPVTYYDLYAYIPYNTEDVELNNIQIMNNGKHVDKLIKNNKYVPCDSAFAGMGIYKYETIKDSIYEAIPNTKSYIFKHLIDHFMINKACAKKGKLYICQNMKLFYSKLTVKELVEIYFRLIFGYENLMKMLILYQRIFKHKIVESNYY